MREAEVQLGLRPDVLRQQVRAGRLAAVKRGRDWWVRPAEVDRYAREVRRG